MDGHHKSKDREKAREEEIQTHLYFVEINLEMTETEPHDDLILNVFFMKKLIVDAIWSKDKVIVFNFKIDFNDGEYSDNVVDNPLVIILKDKPVGKSKDSSEDIKGAGALDLKRVCLGELKYSETVDLVSPQTGESIDCKVELEVKVQIDKFEIKNILTMTLIKVACVPDQIADCKWLAAVGIDDFRESIVSCSFGACKLGSQELPEKMWPELENIGLAARTSEGLHIQDRYFPKEMTDIGDNACNVAYWNICRNITASSESLIKRLKNPLYVELVALSSGNKVETKGKFMALIDLSPLCEPDQKTLTVVAPLYVYLGKSLLENMPLLIQAPMPPSSSKKGAQEDVEPEILLDSCGHIAYVEMQFQIFDSLIPAYSLKHNYNVLGYDVVGEDKIKVIEEWVKVPPRPVIPSIRVLASKGGAFGVHEDLINITKSSMIKGFKKVGVQSLRKQCKEVIKEYLIDGSCSVQTRQDIIWRQYAACRKGVLASMEPPLPKQRAPDQFAVSRSRIFDDPYLPNILLNQIAETESDNPKSYLLVALRHMEIDAWVSASDILKKGLDLQITNRYLLWAYGAYEIDSKFITMAAFDLTVLTECEDGISNAISLAGKHALCHGTENYPTAFVAIRSMRLECTHPENWRQFYKQWKESTGEEEFLWNPSYIETTDPLVMAAAFFLCLRSFRLVDWCLDCAKNNCSIKWAVDPKPIDHELDIRYIECATLIVQRKYRIALSLVANAIKDFGPKPKLQELRTTCYFKSNNLNLARSALQKLDLCGIELSPSILVNAAKMYLKTKPQVALQYAVRAHKKAPCGNSCLLIATAFNAMGNLDEAENWLAAATKREPYLAEAWAELARIKLLKRDPVLARELLRTAKQITAYPIRPELLEELETMARQIQALELPEKLTYDLCFCQKECE